MDTIIDRKEQYTRRNCLLIHDLGEKNNENTDQRILDLLHESVGQTNLFKILTKAIDCLVRSQMSNHG